MAGIYQEIWNADQRNNGVSPILDTEDGSQKDGYVKVNSTLHQMSHPELKVLTEIHIPQTKMATYQLCQKLFNNFTLAEPLPEQDTPEERQEVHDFVTAIIETEPMDVARRYIERETGTVVSRERWHNTIVEMWFRRFSSGGDPELSGFEHVIVGEQEGSKVQGYHFWWKYYLDDGFASQVDDGLANFPGLMDDRITYHGSKQKDGQLRFPESVTISYRWNAPDYEKEAIRPLFKKIGGFFVGCSVEGLMALGTVRAHKGVQAPRIASIEGARYDMKLFHSPNGQHIRTFYPVFLGESDVIKDDDDVVVVNPPVSRDIRIIAALVNPLGEDVGFERITLVNTEAQSISLKNWSIQDKNHKTHVFEEVEIKANEFFTVKLTGRDVQLSNKGSEIVLFDDKQNIVHRVSYSKARAKANGRTILF